MLIYASDTFITNEHDYYEEQVQQSKNEPIEEVNEQEESTWENLTKVQSLTPVQVEKKQVIQKNVSKGKVYNKDIREAVPFSPRSTRRKSEAKPVQKAPINTMQESKIPRIKKTTNQPISKKPVGKQKPVPKAAMKQKKRSKSSSSSSSNSNQKSSSKRMSSQSSSSSSSGSGSSSGSSGGSGSYSGSSSSSSSSPSKK